MPRVLFSEASKIQVSTLTQSDSKRPAHQPQSFHVLGHNQLLLGLRQGLPQEQWTNPKSQPVSQRPHKRQAQS